jgi:hypothetical protein
MVEVRVPINPVLLGTVPFLQPVSQCSHKCFRDANISLFYLHETWDEEVFVFAGELVLLFFTFCIIAFLNMEF